MAGYGIYSGVGGLGQEQESVPKVQSFDDSQIYQNSAGPAYTGPAAQDQGSVQGGGSGSATFGNTPKFGESTSNSGFYGLGGLSKSQYYLPSNAPQELRASNMDPIQKSIQLGGGMVRDQDLQYLMGASQNSRNPYYSGIAQYGIDANQYAGQFQNSGFDPQNAAGFFQQQSQRGKVGGVNYNIDPSFGLRGSIGDLNFDVMQYDNNWNSPAAYNAWNGYLGGQGWETAQQVSQGVGNILNNGGPRGYQFQNGVNSAYRPGVQNEAYMGNGLYFVG